MSTYSTASHSNDVTLYHPYEPCPEPGYTWHLFPIRVTGSFESVSMPGQYDGPVSLHYCQPVEGGA